jgi:hypothetical protein
MFLHIITHLIRGSNNKKLMWEGVKKLRPRLNIKISATLTLKKRKISATLCTTTTFRLEETLQSAGTSASRVARHALASIRPQLLKKLVEFAHMHPCSINGLYKSFAFISKILYVVTLRRLARSVLLLTRALPRDFLRFVRRAAGTN